jgi:DNA-binding beta-propeller fold protein YncE
MGGPVKKLFFAVTFCVMSGLPTRAQTSEPLKLVQTIEMPDVPIGPYTDHLAVDLKGHRLFATPQAHMSVYVFDLDTGKLIRDISGFGNPHSVLYRNDLDQIFVTDGGTGQLKIFSGRDYRLIKSVKLLPDADSIGYDPATKYLYVTNGGEGAKLDYSLLSVVDTTTAEHVGDIKVTAESLEAMVLETSGPRIFIDITDKNQVAVVDRQKRAVVARWPVTKGERNIAIALDETHHRLFVGCRNTESSGVIVVFDTETGKEIEALPIDGWVDYMTYDPKTTRIYASCGKGPSGPGSVYVYRPNESGHYDLLGKAPTAPMAKTALFIPELNRLFVSVPHLGSPIAKIMVFQGQQELLMPK